MIEFKKHYVIDKATGKKARVWYSLDNRTDGRKCVTLYAKSHRDRLFDVFPNDAENNTDIMTDYFEKDKVRLFEGNPVYAIARKYVESIKAA